MFRSLIRFVPVTAHPKQILCRSLFAEASTQRAETANTQSPSDREQSTPRRNINRVCLSGTVSGRPFYGTSRAGTKFAAVRVVTNTFGGQYDFRIRLPTRASIAYCKQHVNEGSRLFVFGRLVTVPKIAADGTQGTSGSIVASRISVEKQSDGVSQSELLQEETSEQQEGTN